VLIYYFSVGARHRLAWHLALWSALLGGVAVNSFWLVNWLDYCWIRAPLQAQTPLLAHRTLATIWAAPLWGEQADRIGISVLICGAIVGVWRFNATRQRPAARLLGLGTAGLMGLAVVGVAWDPLARLGTPRLFVPALWFASLPAAHGLAQGIAFLRRLTGRVWGGLALTATLLGALGLAGQDVVGTFALRCVGTEPLRIGLSPEEQALVQAITTHTTPEARILWEDCDLCPAASHWCALLPILTERAYLGGLDPTIEHAYSAFVDHKLAGRPIGTWRDEELSDFCRHYDAGWAICRSTAASQRFRAWLGTDPVVTIAGSPPLSLYELPKPSFLLKGRARLLQADFRHIALADVIPDGGQVVLSLHYQAGWRVSPSRVQVEREPDPYDPIPMIRLRMPGPVARLSLTWEPP
jgi:hypothetical protein